MSPNTEGPITVFEGPRRITTGALLEVALAAKSMIDRAGAGPILAFDDATGRLVELDLRGTEAEVRARIEADAAPVVAAPVVAVGADQAVEDAHAADGEATDGEGAGAHRTELAAPASATRRGPGRPRLGVVSKEVTLLPRHWAWLSTQRGGGSATLRRLVDVARGTQERRDFVRRAQDATYRFMLAMAGDLPGYEEALRALYAADGDGFARESQDWPTDVREHSRRLSAEAFRGPQPFASDEGK